MRSLLVLAGALTVLDGLATLLWLRLGHAEANPLLVALIDHAGAGTAMAVRVGLGLGLLSALGGVMDRSRLAPYGLIAVTGVLLGVGLWHAAGAVMTLTG